MSEGIFLSIIVQGVKNMTWQRLVRMAVCAILLCAAAWPAQASQEGFEGLRVFYFGNSLTGNAMPGLHPPLGESAGRHWEVEAAIGPGWQVWMHWWNSIRQNRANRRTRLVEDGWDAIVVQPFGRRGLVDVRTEVFMGQVQFDEPTDIGDVNAAAEIARTFLEANPEGRVLVYTSWPGLTGVRERVREIEREEGERRKLTHEEMEPLRREFDFAALWLRPHDPETGEGAATSRDYYRQFMEGLAERLPETARAGRLQLIPMGEVFLTLDRKMRAGELPGLHGIGDYYTDGVHLRAGLPRYTLAATFYAVLFGEHPVALDYELFNEIGNYESGKFGFYVHQPDLGELIEITPERAEIVHDAIWEVVKGHRWTGLSGPADARS